MDYAFLVGGQWRKSREKIEIKNPYNGETVGRVYLASKNDLEDGISKSVEAFEETRRLPSFARSKILREIADRIAARKREIAEVITHESGKPIKDSLGEVERSISTFHVASEEAKRLGGEFLPLDITEAAKGKVGIVRRFPTGVVAAITPFNFPLNLVSHKIAPALAVGNPIILKPATKTPITALILGEIIWDTDWPRGALSILPCSQEVRVWLVRDNRIRMLSFTGSSEVGWALKKEADPRKKVVLELGGNAGVVIHRDADIDYAAKRTVRGAFYYAGQSCISIQRMYIHEDIYRDFMDRFLGHVRNLKVGDPLGEDTDLGPMIDEGAARRTQEWVEEAVREGAQVLIGGKARGSFFEPTVIVKAEPEAKVCSREVFAPLVVVFPYKNIEDALRELNNSAYGLQAGIYTNDQRIVWKAFEEVEVGGVIINDNPTFRVDNMPYGGVKESGFGREGVKYAIEEMSEIKIMVLNLGE